MKVTGITFHSVDDPDRLLVELVTDAKHSGFVIGSADVKPQIERLFRECLREEDPRGVAALWQRMSTTRDSDPAACAALDIALWDLKAKAQHEPLWKSLGTARPKLNAHIRLEGGEDHAAMIAKSGFRNAVVVVKDAPANAQSSLAAAREALSRHSSEPALMLAAAAPWNAKDSIRGIRALEKEFDLTWIEGPAKQWDFLALKRVSNAIRGAVCGGRGLAPSDFLAHLHHHSLDVVQIDLLRTGITGALRVADAAYGFELPVTLCATPGNLGVHVGGAMPYCMSVEIADPDDGDIVIEQGWAIAGTCAGNGLQGPRA